MTVCADEKRLDELVVGRTADESLPVTRTFFILDFGTRGREGFGVEDTSGQQSGHRG